MASDLPVHLLEEIFLCLDDAADLARASVACTSFRRVVSDVRFLRRFRSVHCRAVLGLLLKDRYKTALFYAAQPPGRSAQAAAGFAKVADFNFAFLPGGSPWSVCDVRAGRVLLYRRSNFRSMFEGLVVYDPLHRRHVQIPTVPRDLVLAGNQHDGNNRAMKFDRPFLASAVDDDDDADESSLRFQVMCIALSEMEAVAFVFSSASGQWRRGTSFHNPSYDWTKLIWLWFRQQVHGCVFWVRNLANFMLVFDTREMKFSIIDFPRDSLAMYNMAVEAADGRLGLLLLNKECTTLDLYSRAKEWQAIQEPEEWRHDNSIPIIPGFHFTMLSGVTEGYALLLGTPQDQHKQWIHTHKNKPKEAHYFALELKTLLFEKLRVLKYDETRISFLYANFPPLFSSPGV